jgi:hypothetical protein
MSNRIQIIDHGRYVVNGHEEYSLGLVSQPRPVCTCQSTVRDARREPTAGERAISRAMAMAGGSGSRDACMARAELAYLKRR